MGFVKLLAGGIIMEEIVLLEITIIARLLRLLSQLQEIRTWNVILNTISALLKPFYTLLLVQFTLFYFFALIGLRTFGGQAGPNTPAIVYDTSTPDFYYLMNFNDFGSAMVTLFVLMVVNNWFLISNMFANITNDAVVLQNQATRPLSDKDVAELERRFPGD